MHSCILCFLRQKTRKEKKPNGGGNVLTQKTKRDFPGGPMVENPSTNAGDTSSSTDCGRFNAPSNTEPVQHSYRSPLASASVLRNKRGHRREKPAHRN